MANSSRRYLDNNGNQFMPMNVEGGTWDENFISTKKLVVIGIILFSYILAIMSLIDNGAGFMSWLICLLVITVASIYALRYIVFEERFYYKMYKVMRDYEISTPAIFWDIVSIRNSPDGAILTYSDARIGIVIRLERDTVTGKPDDFKETHYDAISDFYKELMKYKYSFIQMNVMETAGNDPRLDNLEPLIKKSDNANICKLMEREIGYIKNITNNTLYESDYIVIYTQDLSKFDTIISDVIDCAYKLLDGAYVSYRILDSNGIIELVKELYGVKFFDYTKATLDKAKIDGASTRQAFTLSGVVSDIGNLYNIDKAGANEIFKMTSCVLDGTSSIEDISIIDALERQKNKNRFGVDIDTLSDDLSGNVVNPSNKKQRIGKKHQKQVTNQYDDWESTDQDWEDTQPGMIDPDADIDF